MSSHNSLTEAAYLIWKLYCEHAIQHENDPDKLYMPDEITNYKNLERDNSVFEYKRLYWLYLE